MPRNPSTVRSREAGITLVELLVTLGVLAVILGVLSSFLMSSNRTHRKTTHRAELQASSRQALELMTTELRQAGADPRNPPMGLAAVVSADTNTVRVRADLNGDGAIQTTEPSEDVTFTFDAANSRLLRNPGTGNVIALRSVTGLRFRYFDAAGTELTTTPLSSTDRALVRTIGITLTCDDRDTHPLVHTTRVMLRNQGG